MNADDTLLTNAPASSPEIPILLNAPGLHRIEIGYSGSSDHDFARAIPMLVEAVSPTLLPSTVALNISQRNGPKSTVALDATVAHVAGKPGGIMHFYDGGLLIGSTVVQEGSTTLLFSEIELGNHRFKAEYTGDRSFS